tara:strand:+ start:73 stop:654 length:582 start_codon:yes stop_codon:yes gene_type:complete
MEHYTTAQDAFESLNIDKLTKFSKRNASKIVRKLCKILLKHKYENGLDRGSLYLSSSWKGMEKIREKAIAEQIKSDMRGWTEWSYLSFACCSNDGPLIFTDKNLRYAINENEDFVIYTDCYEYSSEKMENIIELLQQNNIELTSFIKKFPFIPNVEDRWKIANSEYKGHYESCSFHRGTLVGFIVKVTYDMFI